MRIYKILLFLILFSSSVLAQISESQYDPSWLIEVKNPDNYIGIALSNGRIGVMPAAEPFVMKSVILNNVYEKESELGVSKIMEGINFVNMRISIDGKPLELKSFSSWKQVLNMKGAFLETSFKFQDKAEISYRTYALRGLPYMALTDVRIKSLKGKINVNVSGIITTPGEMKVEQSTYRVLKDNEIRMPLMQTTAKSQFGRHLLAATATFIFDGDEPAYEHIIVNNVEHQLNFSRKLEDGENLDFAWAGAICTTQDFSDPQNESERMVIYLMRNNKNMAIENHRKLWENLWQGDIIVDGDQESQQDIRLALYHLYSFSSDNTGLSIPPMGLSSRIYNGHIFWDTELWMFPPLLVFNQGIAASLLDYRYNRLDKARQKAASYGYKGAMYPWESDDTGEEATPSWALTGTFEHHITADIGIAFWNYFRVTRDTTWLRKKGFPVLSEIAKFWVSRAEKNPDGSWSINNVVGVNEFAPNINDNAFTNGAVKAVLKYAVSAMKVLGLEANEQWLEVSDKLIISRMQNGVTKEHRDYDGAIIKQVDVNLLAYPLAVITDKEQIKRDLEYYESKLAPEGPAMSHSILSILYSGMGDNKMAFRLFKKSFELNKRPPFGALAETADFNNTYFATGAGGLLQAVIFGFGGLQITENGIIQKSPCLPAHWKSLNIKGVGPEKKTFSVIQQQDNSK